jgi:hypothetical protein
MFDSIDDANAICETFNLHLLQKGYEETYGLIAQIGQKDGKYTVDFGQVPNGPKIPSEIVEELRALSPDCSPEFVRLHPSGRMPERGTPAFTAHDLKL